MKKYIILCLAAIGLSCTQADKFSEARLIYEQSMEIHDKVMPKMDDAFTLRQKLTKDTELLKRDSISTKPRLKNSGW